MKKSKDVEIPSEIMHTLLFKRVDNKEDLSNWLKLFIKVDLADCTVSRFSTSNPLDMVWKIYKFCLDAETGDQIDPANMFFIAGRGSQKTLSVACLQIILPFHFKRSFTHFGGSQDQARRAYQYFMKFVEMPYIKDYLKDKPTQQKTIFNLNGEEVELEILSITPLSVQGRHSSAVSLDELASLTPDKRKAYQDIGGVPTYTQDGKAWIKFGISSRKGRYTIVETEYESKDKSGTQFEFWTVLENTKQCPDSISGTEPMTFYVDAIQNLKYDEAGYNKLAEDKKSKLEKINAFKNCYTCALATSCSGDSKKQTSNCKSLRPIQATIAQFKQSPSHEWWLSQAMSMQPSMEGLIFSKFRRETFEKTPAEIWQIFTGSSTYVDLTEDMLIESMCNAGVKRYMGLDHGSTHPTAFVVIYEDSVGRIFIMRTFAQSGLDPNEVVNYVKQLHTKYRFTHIYPDLAAPQINNLIKKAKICSVSDNWVKTANSVNDGIALIRTKISPHNVSMKTMLYGVKGNCEGLITEFEKYHYVEDSEGNLQEEAEKEFDDCFTEGHEILTKNGWKYFKDLVENDEVAAVTKDKKILFENPSRIIKKHYKGEIYNFNNNNVNFSVTPNHNIAYITQYSHKKNKTHEINLIKAKDFNFKEIYIPASACIDGNSNYVQPFPDWKLNSYDWGWLLGFFLAEGCSHQNINTKQKTVMWDQKKIQHIKSLEIIMNKLGLVYNFSKTVKPDGMNRFLLSGELPYNYFKQFGKAADKFIPRDVLNSNDIELLKGVFEGMMCGDGSREGPNNDYTTVSAKLANDFCELSVLLGYTSRVKGPYIPNIPHHLPYYKVRIRKRKNYPTYHIPISRVEKKFYDGIVYCVTVSTGMILCRNKESGNFISGNCVDSLRYAALNRWNKGRTIIGSPNPQIGKNSKESPEAYKKATEGKIADWLRTEIDSAVKENNNGEVGPSSGVQKSKGGGIKWDI